MHMVFLRATRPAADALGGCQAYVHGAKEGQQTLPAAYTLLYGGIAGILSECVVYPLEVVRRRMQLQSMAAATSAGASVQHAYMGAHTPISSIRVRSRPISDCIAGLVHGAAMKSVLICAVDMSMYCKTSACIL